MKVGEARGCREGGRMSMEGRDEGGLGLEMDIGIFGRGAWREFGGDSVLLIEGVLCGEW